MSIFGKKRETPDPVIFRECDNCEPDEARVEYVNGVPYTYRLARIQLDYTRGKGNDRGFRKTWRDGVRVAVYKLDC